MRGSGRSLTLGSLWMCGYVRTYPSITLYRPNKYNPPFTATGPCICPFPSSSLVIAAYTKDTITLFLQPNVTIYIQTHYKTLETAICRPNYKSRRTVMPIISYSFPANWKSYRSSDGGVIRKRTLSSENLHKRNLNYFLLIRTYTYWS